MISCHKLGLSGICQTEIYRTFQAIESYSWKEAHQIGPVMDSFVSEVQGLMCIEIQVPTESLIGGFWVQARRVTQLARQTGNFEADILT